MNITTYFIKYPVTAIILNLLIILLGTLSFIILPIREYPSISFPTLTVNFTYPNASAELIESSIISLFEDCLAGIEGIDDITSHTSDGSGFIEVRFKDSVNKDYALISVREAVALSRSYLPKEVSEPIIEFKSEADHNPLIIILIESSQGNLSDLTHYANLYLKNAFRTLSGVASAQVWGYPYTYVITLDPKKMFEFKVNADEIYEAIKNSNLVFPVGKFQNVIPTTISSIPATVQEYENLVIGTDKAIQKNLSPLLLKYIAQVKFITNDHESRIQINGKQKVCITIHKTNGANPIVVSKLVHEKVSELKNSLSEFKIDVIQDNTKFIKASIKNIYWSFLEAIIFVSLIVFFFLRNIKSTLIPIITIPISLMGVMIFLKLFGFSINIMTLMAMVLAVGMVVDDSIVLLENIFSHHEKGSSILDSTIFGSKEISFAIIAMTLTLISVYFPIAFIPGPIGQIFIEFAVCLAGSVIISGFVSLTLSPLMCHKILINKTKSSFVLSEKLNLKLEIKYKKILEKSFYYKNLFIVTIIISMGGSILLFEKLPNEIIPKEDRDLIGIFIPSLEGENINNVQKRIIKVENIIKSLPEIQQNSTFVSKNGGNIILPLDSITKRQRTSTSIANNIRNKLNLSIPYEFYVWSWDSNLPSFEDIHDNSQLNLIISTTENYQNLFNQANQLIKILKENNISSSIYQDLYMNSLSYKINIDKYTLATLGLNEHQIAKTIEIFFSGDQSLTFQKDGMIYPIKIEGQTYPWTLNELYIRNNADKNISLGTVATMTSAVGPKDLHHYNQNRATTLSINLNGNQEIESLKSKISAIARKKLPNNYKIEWVGLSKTSQESNRLLKVTFFLSLIFIYGVLAIQFKSFIDPLIIMLTIPLAIFGALLTLWLFGYSINIFTQVGLITLIGLLTKHGILIIEFSNQLNSRGLSLLESIQKASMLRLRPILMTTGAMFISSIPLVLSQDSGSEIRNSIGIVILGGLAFGTLCTLVILPSLCFIIKQANQTLFPKTFYHLET